MAASDRPDAAGMKLIRRLPVLRHLWQRPRLTLSLCLAVVLALVLTWTWPGHVTTRILIAYNAGAALYLILAGRMMLTATLDHICSRAKQQDDGQIAVLIGVMLASVVTLLAIAAHLSIAKDLVGWSRYAHIALAAATVVTSWSFTQTMFALHYAHAFYGADEGAPAGGLQFPGTAEPDYIDFLYVACVIGTSGQTADVAFSSSELRRIGLLHCVLSFFYNATLIALTINMAAGLMQ